MTRIEKTKELFSEIEISSRIIRLELEESSRGIVTKLCVHVNYLQRYQCVGHYKNST